MTLLLWFRNDLRVHDNPALYYVLQQLENTQSKGRAVYFLTPKLWQQQGIAEIKIDLILRHVIWLQEALAVLGIELQLVECEDEQGQFTYLKGYVQQHAINQLVINQDLYVDDSPLTALSLDVVSFEADVIVPKGQLRTGQGEMFKVFTPFKNAWLKYVTQHGFEYISKHQLSNYIQAANQVAPLTSDRAAITLNELSLEWPLIKQVEQKLIPEFLDNKHLKYAEQRDFPAIDGTSKLSPYLAIGALSPRYLLTLLLNRAPDLLDTKDSPNFSWLNELIWRDFYRHLLAQFPKLRDGANFNEKYDAIVWRNDKREFAAWCQGKTGYPLVDAAMRQLNQTGWMHNRLRMVVASFLTKHLLIDWRWGEKYFYSKLIDGDFAANNGGWQWAASTGCDAQPYFRIFNPINQSKNYDPDGNFIRNYLPELDNVPLKELHFPHKYLSANKIDSYWPPIVDHQAARQRALETFKQIK